VLGEAVLIDFIRFTDDFVVFSDTPADAEYGIRILGETLFLNHGLTLQTAKTKVLHAAEYLETYLQSHDAKEANRRELIEIVGGYDSTLSYDELSIDQRAEVDALNLSEMLTEALAAGHNVDFERFRLSLVAFQHYRNRS